MASWKIIENNDVRVFATEKIEAWVYIHVESGEAFRNLLAWLYLHILSGGPKQEFNLLREHLQW